MAGGMQEIKRRIQSVESTKKITKAMELVATSKLQRAKKQLEAMKPYYLEVQDMVSHILCSDGDVKESEYLQNNAGKEVYIIITSSLGLCGGYNSNIIKLAQEELGENDIVYTIGSRSRGFLRQHPGEIIDTYEELNTTIDFIQIIDMVEELLTKYRNKEISKIHVLYTEFVHNLSFIARKATVLPIRNNDTEDAAKDSQEILFEPNATVVLEALIPMYLQSVLYGYLVESITSENASRRTSMESAIDNAEELLDELVLRYNQARQTAITNEITEIISGANVQ